MLIQPNGGLTACAKRDTSKTYGNKAYSLHISDCWAERIYGRPRPREFLFASIASTAESFRSTCGSVRGAPECSKQGSPGATPHVGQGTENHSFAVRSLFLILIQYGKTSRKTVPFSTL